MSNTTNVASFSSNVNGKKQYMKFNECADKVKKDTKCWVLQSPILGPLLFLFYVNNLLSLQTCLFE